MLRAICFYLPQYHPIPENDAWWGAGFTEWTNVAKAVPNFDGHYQPRVPSELGFYDLRLPEVQAKQAALARAHGIHGFCYYHYWFGGRRVLERPLEQLLAHPEIDFPFCVCWANENWTRAWDGREDDVLLAQNHSPEDDEAFLRALLPALRDPRYIRVGGKPLLAVYRVDLFPDMRATAARWRRIAREAGFPDLHLCAVQFYGITDPRPWGFDAAIEFPPHQFIGPENRPDAIPAFTNPRFAGGVVDYQKIASQALRREVPDYPLYRGVMPSWDNTARRQDTPHIIVNSSPLDYQYWLRRVAEQTRRVRPPDEQLVFINAWNEWGEGCYLEPDARYGRAYLEATRSALQGMVAIDELFDEFLAGLGLQSANGAVDEVRRAFDARERSLYALQDVIRQKNAQISEMASRIDALGAQLASPLGAVARRELAKYPRLKATLKRLLGRP
ncbi:MAG TPA: glycoside hydrolase family 99-like domain-containing protein [Candidatus Binatia bacterium]|nr:glycoside hydrolase family 99-like domain-containing protein [Candidatus Binatia bacterium]